MATIINTAVSTFSTPDQIAKKKHSGLTLTAWETSVYRLNFRDDGTRYSADPKIRDQQYEEDIAQQKGAR